MAKAKAVTIYGIKNCDTMKKARAWLDARGVAYAFHDYKTAGIERGMLEAWVREVGWETLLNRAGTTFRKLAENDKNGLTERKAVALMLGPTFDDQTACARRGRQVVRRVQAGSVRTGAWHAVAGFIGACAWFTGASDVPQLVLPAELDRAGCGEPMRSSCTIWATRRVVAGWFRWWAYGQGPDRER